MIKLLFKIRELLLSNNILVKPFYPILYFFYRFILLLYGASIPLNTKFHDIPIFPHSLYGIFISGDANIGKRVTIYHQVTIGSITTKSSKHIGAPTVEDDVIIGAGAKVIGKIKIGSFSKIGANCVVVENIGQSCTVVLPKSRVIRKNDG